MLTLLCGDCRKVMAAMDQDIIDAVVTDPPYGLGFMGKDWDCPGGTGDFPMRRTTAANTVNTGASRQGGRQRSCVDWARRQTRDMQAFQTWSEEWAKDVLRVLKPGAHLLAFGGTRTFHRLACALEDAGFEIRDCVMWIYGEGFPKSLDVSKAIDKAKGANREVVGTKLGLPGYSLADNGRTNEVYGDLHNPEAVCAITAPATPEAAKWTGWGTALKPAWEPIIVARKPLVGTVAENVQQHGTGALNIDGCRVATSDSLNGGAYSPDRRPSISEWVQHGGTIHNSTGHEYVQPLGRWPANVIHDGSDEVLACFPDAPGQQADQNRSGEHRKAQSVYGPMKRGNEPTADKRYSEAGGTDFSMMPGARRLDTGSAARFFYCAKADKAERGNGNTHPTVKPLALMEYLCRLVSRPGHKGVLLDPFAGSGSTLLCASKWFERVIGIEQDEQYATIAASRLRQETLFT